MISVGTKLRVADNSGAKLAKCLKTLGTANKKIAYVGGLILVALKRFKGKKKVSKNIVYIGLIIGQAFWTVRNEGTKIKFFSNRVLIFSKQFKFLGTRVYGLIQKEVKSRNLKNKKYRTYFKKIITYSSFII